MATLMPTRITAIAQEPLDHESLALALRPWRRRLSTQQVVYWTARGMVSGLILACLVLLAARFIPWITASYWALGLGIACAIITLGAALWLRPSIGSAARSVDRLLALHDRMGTAWELREQSSVLARLQRRDALKQLKKYTPPSTISLRLHRSTLLTFVVIALMLALLVFLPNPMDAVAKQQAAFQAQIVQQIKNIDKARLVVAHQPNTPAAEKQKIDQI